jgi:hypothetical protein
MSESAMKQVVIGTQYTVDVMQGGLGGKCVHAKYGFNSTAEAQYEIRGMKKRFEADGVDTADYLYVIRPVDKCDWVYDKDYIKELDAHARDLYINKLDHDPIDDGLEYFVAGFIEGVLAQQEERV